MKKLMKGDPTLNAVTLIVAGVVGMLTGSGVEGLPPLGKLGVAVLVGLVAGGLLYAVLRVWKRHRPP
jgi:4-hydroxybenzoate polyprenyltransferase